MATIKENFERIKLSAERIARIEFQHVEDKISENETKFETSLHEWIQGVENKINNHFFEKLAATLEAYEEKLKTPPASDATPPTPPAA